MYFRGVARVDKVLECSNFGNMPLRWAQPPVKKSASNDKLVKIKKIMFK
jgi:hypothetical protein